MKLQTIILTAAVGLSLTACTTEKKEDSKSVYLMALSERTVHNGACYDAFEAEQYEALAVTLATDSSYVDLTMGSVLPDLRDYSISVFYNVSSENDLEGYGHFLFAFSALAENKATEGPYMAMRLNEQRFEVSTGGWENEHIIQQGGKPERDVWHHALYRQTGTTGELYIDGVLIGTNPDMPILADIFTEAPAYCWIGRAPFNGDKYLTKTEVKDFRLYDYAVTDEERIALGNKEL